MILTGYLLVSSDNISQLIYINRVKVCELTRETQNTIAYIEATTL